MFLCHWKSFLGVGCASICLARLSGWPSPSLNSQAWITEKACMCKVTVREQSYSFVVTDSWRYHSEVFILLRHLWSALEGCKYSWYILMWGHRYAPRLKTKFRPKPTVINSETQELYSLIKRADKMRGILNMLFFFIFNINQYLTLKICQSVSLISMLHSNPELQRGTNGQIIFRDM